MDRPNVILLMTDQHHPDYMSAAEHPKASTPNLDFLAQGMRFQICVTPNPVCTPARCGLMTARYPHQVGMMTMSGCLDPDYPTFPQALQQGGYYTAAAGKLHLLQGWHWDAPRGGGHDLVALKEHMKRYGFHEIWEAAGKGLSLTDTCDYCAYLGDRGLLERYRDELERRRADGHPEYPAPSESFGIAEDDHVDKVIADQAIYFLQKRPKDQPFFLFTSFLSPHPIIDPPQAWLDKTPMLPDDQRFIQRTCDTVLSEEMKRRWSENRRGYRALVQFVDHQIGRILSALRAQQILDNTVIIFCSDHGDLLGDYGVDGKNRPERGSSNVPLLIRHPDHLNAAVCQHPVSLIDVAATILEVAGLDIHESLSMVWPAWNHVIPAQSLMPAVRDGSMIRPYTFTENDQFDMLQTRTHRYVRYRESLDSSEPIQECLYDLVHDPDELADCSGDPQQQDLLIWFRVARDHVITSTPAGQMGHLPVHPSGQPFTRIRPDWPDRF